MTSISRNYYKNFEIITFIERTDDNKCFYPITRRKTRESFQKLKQHLHNCLKNIYKTEFAWRIGNITYYIVIREIDEKHPQVIYDNESDLIQFDTFLNNYICDLKCCAKEEEEY